MTGNNRDTLGGLVNTDNRKLRVEESTYVVVSLQIISQSNK